MDGFKLKLVTLDSVDSDFPPLIMSDPLSKYGFNVLAVVLVQQLGDGYSIQVQVSFMLCQHCNFRQEHISSQNTDPASQVEN